MSLDRVFLNIERADGPISGRHYIAATLREDASLAKLIWITAERCGHQNRICTDCAHVWAWDYQLYFDRTARGRLMAEELLRLGRDPVEIAHGRVARWPSDTDVTSDPSGDDEDR